MQYLVVFVPKEKFKIDGKPADFSAIEIEEQEQVKVLYGEGGLRQVWAHNTEERGGTALFEATSPHHLQEMIDSFPLVKADYAEYQILPLAPYPAFVKLR